MFLIKHVVNSGPFSINQMHHAAVTISLIVTESRPKTINVSERNFSMISEIYFVLTVCYKSVNAHCVAVTAKAIQPCVRSKRFLVYEVNGKCARSQRVKVYIVNARNMLVSNYISLFRVGRRIVFVFTVFCSPIWPYGYLSITKSCPLYSLKPVKPFIITFYTTQSIIRCHANRKTRVSSLCSLRLFNVMNSIFVTTSCSLYNLKTFKIFYETLHQYKSSSDHIQSSACDYIHSFFLSFSFGFRVTRRWTSSIYSNNVYTAASITFVCSRSWKPTKIISLCFFITMFWTQTIYL